MAFVVHSDNHNHLVLKTALLASRLRDINVHGIAMHSLIKSLSHTKETGDQHLLSINKTI